MNTVDCPVLIVGGGVTGLSSAMFLASHGVHCVLVERHPDLLIHPRARGLTPRTMEVYRQVGLEQPILAAAYAGPDFAWTPITADTLSDETYAQPDEPQEDDGSGSSPSPFGPVDQDRLEVLVRGKARELGADLRFNTELRSFEQDDDGVTATVVDRATGQETTIRSRYLIGADGINSPLRQALGVETDGPGPLFSTITAIVDADLNPALRGRTATIAYLQQPQPFTILMTHDAAGKRWVFGTGYDPRYSAPGDFTDDRVAGMVRAAAGLPDAQVTLRPQIPGTDIKVLAFPIVAQVARRFRTGRAFLVGDAAHSWPPTGGLGANTGIQDTHNLAWKLAAVLDGRAGDALLDTYHDERRPTALLTMGQAMARFGTRMADGDGPEIIDYGAVSMGYRYRTTREVPDVPAPLLPRELTGQPGSRAPHCEVTLDGRPISTLDLYGRRFVVLTGPDGGAWVEAANGLDVETYRFGDRLAPAEAAKAHGIEADGALLVRPDGFVAWRSVSASPSPTADLTATLNAILHPPTSGGSMIITGFQGELLKRGDDGYDSARSVWNAMVDRHPALIARCTSVADVVAAVRFGRDSGMEIGVRCGGHSVLGLPIIDGGLVVDLTPLDAVDVDPERRIARVQGGALLRALDEAAQQHGLGTTAGNVSHTGVGGLTLGGGMGWLARQHGLSCDNLVSVELVTAHGEVVRASDEENPELFWGLRGGGGNFGVVTEFVFRLHPIHPRVLLVDLFFPAEDAAAPMQLWRDMLADAPREATFTAWIGTAGEWPHIPAGLHGRPVAGLGYVWAGDPDEGRRLLRALRALGHAVGERVREMSYLDLQRMDDDVEGHAFRRYWKGHYLRWLPDDAIKAFLSRDGQLAPAASLQAYGGAIADVADDASAFSHRDALVEFIAAARWTDPAEDRMRIAAARSYAATLETFASGVYVNVLSDEGQSGVSRAYPAAKLARLTALKNRYDPENAFHLTHNIRPST